MQTLYLIRHAQTSGQDFDAPLTAHGQQQAIALAQHIKQVGPEYIVSSPMLRAKQTAQAIADATNQDIIIEQDLRERVLCGTPREDWLTLLEASFLDKTLCWEGGESAQHAQDRAMGVIQTLKQLNYKTICVITHGNLLALMLNAFEPTHGFETWRALSSPDLWSLTLETPNLKRIPLEP